MNMNEHVDGVAHQLAKIATTIFKCNLDVSQVESNLLTLFFCGQLFLSCILLLLLLLITCCPLLLVLRTLGAASPTMSLELTLGNSTSAS